jgi:DNA-binding protein HU-beta
MNLRQRLQGRNRKWRADKCTPRTHCRQRCLRDGELRSYRRPVTKQQLIVALAQRLDMSKVRASEIVDALFASDGLIASELRRSGRVQITGFGNFEVRRRAGRSMRNPRTGKTISLPASVTPAFKAGKRLKDAVVRRRS